MEPEPLTLFWHESLTRIVTWINLFREWDLNPGIQVTSPIRLPLRYIVSG